MVEAGWAWDPNDESDDRDGVTCFYCNLSLDGWEPKDDPFVEHKRREPACPFFSLLEHYHGMEVADGKTKKGKPRGKASARTSTASKASRLSVQSTMSAMSEVPSMGASLADLEMEDGTLAAADDSIVTTATTASQAKGKKKTAKPKAAAKGTKGKKKAPVGEDAMEVDYPELSQQGHVAEEEEDEIVTAPAKATRKTTKAVTRQLDSSVVEISQMDVIPKKATRGRKPKVQQQPEPEPEEIPQTPDAEAIAEQRLSEISAQLQDELDHTVDDYPLDQSTPVVEAPKPKRGVKRTSDGARKQQSSDSSAFEVDVPALPKEQPAPKAKRGRKPKQTSTASTDAEQENQDLAVNEDTKAEELVDSFPEPAAKKPRGRPKGKKNSSARSSNASQTITVIAEPDAQPDELSSHHNEPQPVAKRGRGRPKGSKKSSARSSGVSQTSVLIAEPQVLIVEQSQSEEPEARPTWPREQPEDLVRDEMEIETEFERIASEQQSLEAVEVEQNQVDEYEISPSQGRLSKDSAEIQQLEQEIQQEKDLDVEKPADSPPRLSLDLGTKGDAFTFSPNGSDKENRPSSIPRPSAAKRSSQKNVFMSPTKTTRIPLAPGTPNNRSPTRAFISPSKAQISQLTSTTTWEPVDLDTVLLGLETDENANTPGRVGQALALAAQGTLSAKERGMSVEEWVRWRAEVCEDEFRRKGEGMVAAFEREGVRGLRCLEGIEVVG